MSDYIPSFYRYVSSITIDNGGAGYQNVPTITISGGNGTGATATAKVYNGAISEIEITNIGSGYTSTPTVTVTPHSVGGKLEDTIQLAVVDSFIEQDGYVDDRKVKVSPYDNDEDGTPDYPLSIDDIIQDTVDAKNYITFESYVEFDGYTYYRLSTTAKVVSALTNSGIEFLTTSKKFYNNGNLLR